jgi:hypothetical protein
MRRFSDSSPLVHTPPSYHVRLSAFGLWVSPAIWQLGPAHGGHSLDLKSDDVRTSEEDLDWLQNLVNA